MHCWVMMLSLFAISGTGPKGYWLESVGGMIIYSFIILLGLGKLSDLRYLKVIGAILSSSILLTVAVHAVLLFTGYSYLGWAMLVTLPITILFAQFIKMQIDKGECLAIATKGKLCKGRIREDRFFCVIGPRQFAPIGRCIDNY